MPFEVTTLRRDVETFGRHATVAFTEDWEEDARRRDFTLNALYADRDGSVFDPLGGYDDLAAGSVRFIGDAEERIKEDYLAHPPLLPLQRLLRQGLARCRRTCRMREVARRTRPAFGGAGGGRAAQASSSRLKPCAPIEALFDYGLLTQLLGGVPRLLRFADWLPRKRRWGLRPKRRSGSRRLRSSSEEDAARLAARLRLSNAEQAVLLLGADDHAGRRTSR